MRCKMRDMSGTFALPDSLFVRILTILSNTPANIGSPNRTRKGKLVSTTHTIVEISSEGTFGCRLHDQ